MRKLRTKRERLEAAIEAAIAFLDAIDGDPDFEEGVDLEPSLGWCLLSESGYSGDQTRPGYLWGNDDREVDAADEGEPDEDEERWRQPVHTPLVHFDEFGVGWSQGDEVERRPVFRVQKVA